MFVTVIHAKLGKGHQVSWKGESGGFLIAAKSMNVKSELSWTGSVDIQRVFSLGDDVNYSSSTTLSV